MAEFELPEVNAGSLAKEPVTHSPAALYALWCGLGMIMFSIVAFLITGPAVSEQIGLIKIEHSYGLFLDFWALNILNKFAYFAFGCLGMIYSFVNLYAKRWAIVTGIFFGLVAVLGCLPLSQYLFGYAPIYGPSVWLNASISILAFYYASKKDPNVRIDKKESEKEKDLSQTIDKIIINP